MKLFVWCCYYYGKFLKWVILYPIYNFRIEIQRIEQRIYRHGVKVRHYWDRYMFKQEARDLEGEIKE